MKASQMSSPYMKPAQAELRSIVGQLGPLMPSMPCTKLASEGVTYTLQTLWQMMKSMSSGTRPAASMAR